MTVRGTEPAERTDAPGSGAGWRRGARCAAWVAGSGARPAVGSTMPPVPPVLGRGPGPVGCRMYTGCVCVRVYSVELYSTTNERVA